MASWVFTSILGTEHPKVFALCKKLFAVNIVEASDGAPVWHPDVKFFHVNDEASGERLASFFLDPYARPENKRGGAWMDVCVGKSAKMGKIPVAYLTCNGSPPVGDKPSLMTFSEVTTLFHETGHGLQHMLTQVPHAPAAGISGVEWDAVELPSQFMEVISALFPPKQKRCAVHRFRPAARTSAPTDARILIRTLLRYRACCFPSRGAELVLRREDSIRRWSRGAL